MDIKGSKVRKCEYNESREKVGRENIQIRSQSIFFSEKVKLEKQALKHREVDQYKFCFFFIPGYLERLKYQS